MKTLVAPIIEYAIADEEVKHRIENEWSEKAARHMHLSDGVSIVAVDHGRIVGLISVYQKMLPPPFVDRFDWYIDIVEVRTGYRRKGIATHLVEMIEERAKQSGVYQIRAWSSADKSEAMFLWKALRFALCPAVTYPQGKEVPGYFVAKVM